MLRFFRAVPQKMRDFRSVVLYLNTFARFPTVFLKNVKISIVNNYIDLIFVNVRFTLAFRWKKKHDYYCNFIKLVITELRSELTSNCNDFFIIFFH